MYIGFGYDMHRLAPGRRLVLGGVSIPFDRGLQGHSDADVLTHALMDALLGAAGLRDIGHYFPNSDPALAGAHSMELLHRVMTAVTGEGMVPVNVDCTVVAEAPKLGPYLDEMKANIAVALGLPPRRVGIKATTNEGLGAVGAGDGIAAFAVACLQAPPSK